MLLPASADIGTSGKVACTLGSQCLMCMYPHAAPAPPAPAAAASDLVAAAAAAAAAAASDLVAAAAATPDA